MTRRSQEAVVMKKALDRRFFKKGMTIAALSGISYGLFTAFLNLGMATGVWANWSLEAGFSAFVIIYVVSAMGSAMLYTMSAVWSLIVTAMQGKFGDFLRCLNTKSGRMILLAALLGGPVAGTAYVIAMQNAGAIVVPITALNAAFGAILSRILYKQPLTPRTLCGIGICLLSSVMIAGTSLGAGASEGMVIGIVMGFIAALGWGFEGCIAGYSTAMVDYQIGIAIRQLTGGIANLCLVLPLLSLFSGEGATFAWSLLGQALTDGPSLLCFIASGFFAMYAYSFWYKGNSMCGTALGMACSGAYSFWAPFFSWLLLGVVAGQSGWDIAPIGWLSSVVMVLGIVIIAVNPLDYLRRRNQQAD